MSGVRLLSRLCKGVNYSISLFVGFKIVVDYLERARLGIYQ